MRLTIIIVLIFIAVTALVSVGFISLKNARHATSPFLAYGQASAVEAQALGKRLGDSLNAGEAKDFDEAFDLTAVVGEALLPVPLFQAERERFITSFIAGMNKGAAGTVGSQIATAAKGGMVRLVRVHEVAGRQRALMRFVTGAGALNYFDLVMAKDALGHVRVIDYYNYLNGQMFNEIIASVALPAIAESKKTPLSSLLVGGEHVDMDAFVEFTRLFREGKHAEALTRWKTLAESLRTTRTCLFLRMQCAQAIGGDEYQQAIDAITRAFPGDGSLALIQIDGFVLRKDWTQALACIDQVERSVGGDPYLDCFRAGVLQIAGRPTEAEAAMARYLAAEPAKKQTWWSAVDLALAAKHHAETARLLCELERRFHVTFKDFTTVPSYADFVTSPEYAEWLKRPTVQTVKPEQETQEAALAAPAPTTPAAPAP